MAPLEFQFYAFLVLALTAVGAGMLFDLLCVLRWRLRPGVVAGAVADLAYWAVVTLLIGTGLLLGNRGEMRLYVPVALALGAGLYFAWGSPVVLGLLDLAVGAVAWVWGLLCTLVGRLLVAPAVAVGLVLWRAARWVGATATRAGAAAGRLAWQPVHRMGRRVNRWTGALTQRFLDTVLGWFLPPPDPPAGEDASRPGDDPR